MRGSVSSAKAVLRSRGFEIIGERVPVMIEGYEVSDVDLVAKKDGQTYAVEVKNGRVDVGGIRQAYVNALIMGAKPLLVCRGFSDRPAEALARELSIEVIELDDLFISDPEELRSIIREEVRRAILEVLPSVINPPKLESRDIKILRALAQTESFLEAAELLGFDVNDLGREMKRMRSEGKIPRWLKDYSELREWTISLIRSCRESFSPEPVG